MIELILTFAVGLCIGLVVGSYVSKQEEFD